MAGLIGSIVGATIKIYIFSLLFKLIGRKISPQRSKSLIIGYTFLVIVDLILLFSINGPFRGLDMFMYDIPAIILFVVIDIVRANKKSVNENHDGVN